RGVGRGVRSLRLGPRVGGRGRRGVVAAARAREERPKGEQACREGSHFSGPLHPRTMSMREPDALLSAAQVAGHRMALVGKAASSKYQPSSPWQLVGAPAGGMRVFSPVDAVTSRLTVVGSKACPSGGAGSRNEHSVALFVTTFICSRKSPSL